MNPQDKVVWSEGLFLRPQLFQQQERHFEHVVHQRALAHGPHGHGFSACAIDTQALAFGRLVLASAAGIMPDGTVFSAPTDAGAPAPLTITSEHVGQVIMLALPLRLPGRADIDLGASDAPAPDATARYAVFETDLPDSTAIGLGPKTVQLGQLRLRLLPQSDLGSDWIGLPVARVLALQAGGSAVLDTMIPPLTVLSASATLTTWLDNVILLCQTRTAALSDLLTGQGGPTRVASDISDILVLQILNRHLPLLKHLRAAPQVAPERFHLLLATLCGELCTYRQQGARHLSDSPIYAHLDPYPGFKRLIDELLQLLNDTLTRGAEQIPLTQRPHGVSIAALPPAHLATLSSLVFAVTAQLPAEQIARQFPAHCKAAPGDRLPELLRSHLPGLELRHLPVPPRQIPCPPGSVHFQVEPQGPLWDHLRHHGALALHVGAELPGLALELWGIRAR